jgi:hypothetical protein
MLNKFETRHLKDSANRLSVLNWGTKWEQRRYALMLGFCDLVADAGDDYNIANKALKQFSTLPLADRIDIACHTMHSGHMHRRDGVLSVDMSQFSKRQERQYFQNAWKMLLCDAEEVKRPNETEEYFNQAINAYLVGVFENILFDYGNLDVLLETETWTVRLFIEPKEQNIWKTSVHYETKKQDLELDLQEFLKPESWNKKEGSGFTLETQKFTREFSGEYAAEKASRAASEAVQGCIRAAKWESSKIVWKLAMPEVSKFDKQFALARSKTISSFLNGNQFNHRFRFAI